MARPPSFRALIGDRGPILIVLLGAGALSSTTGGVVDPIFPEIVESLAIDPRWVGVVASIHILMTALAGPVMGLLADRLGKRPILLTCLVAYGVFGLAGGLATSVPALVVSRALVGIASGGLAAASIGWVSALYDGQARTIALGYTASALATASVFFPLLSGALGGQDWRWSFGLYGLALPMAAIASWLLRHDRGGDRANLGQLSTLRRTLGQVPIQVACGGLGLASAFFAVVIIYGPLHFKAAIGATPLLNGEILAARAVGAALMSAFGASRLARWLGTNRAIALGLGAMGLALGTIPLFVDERLILVDALLFGVGFGAVMPNLYDWLSQMAPVSTRSTILALGNGCAALGHFLSPLLLGPIWKYQGTAVFYVAAIAAVAVGGAALGCDRWAAEQLAQRIEEGMGDQP